VWRPILARTRSKLSVRSEANVDSVVQHRGETPDAIRPSRHEPARRSQPPPAHGHQRTLLPRTAARCRRRGASATRARRDRLAHDFGWQLGAARLPRRAGNRRKSARRRSWGCVPCAPATAGSPSRPVAALRKRENSQDKASDIGSTGMGRAVETGYNDRTAVVTLRLTSSASLGPAASYPTRPPRKSPPP